MQRDSDRAGHLAQRQHNWEWHRMAGWWVRVYRTKAPRLSAVAVAVAVEVVTLVTTERADDVRGPSHAGAVVERCCRDSYCRLLTCLSFA